MSNNVFHPVNWQLLSIEGQLAFARNKDEDPGKSSVPIWDNSAKIISPLSFYSYLKLKFGSPNGFVMKLKNPSTDNLIHWQYAFKCEDAVINIWGKTAGIEISIQQKSIQEVSDAEWQMLIKNIQSELQKQAKDIKVIQSQFEQWSLFINPFSRIERTVMEYVVKLEKINLKEPLNFAGGSDETIKKYLKGLSQWTKNVSKATSLGTVIRMLCPVMAECFVNLILLVFRKPEFAADERMYDALIRQQIDVRVKMLHLNCTCFLHPIDGENEAFRKFHSLMNRRNDFLHGNIDPYKLVAEDVWFDQKYIPLLLKTVV